MISKKLCNIFPHCFVTISEMNPFFHLHTRILKPPTNCRLHGGPGDSARCLRVRFPVCNWRADSFFNVLWYGRGNWGGCKNRHHRLRAAVRHRPESVCVRPILFKTQGIWQVGSWQLPALNFLNFLNIAGLIAYCSCHRIWENTF